jgi:hypothetical protein
VVCYGIVWYFVWCVDVLCVVVAIVVYLLCESSLYPPLPIFTLFVFALSHTHRLLQSQNDNPDFVATRLARAAVEGAAQLLTYQAARDYVHQVAPYFEGLRDLQAM